MLVAGRDERNRTKFIVQPRGYELLESGRIIATSGVRTPFELHGNEDEATKNENVCEQTCLSMCSDSSWSRLASLS